MEEAQSYGHPSQPDREIVAFLGIDYNDRDPDSFRGITASVCVGGREIAARNFDRESEATEFAVRHGAERIFCLSSFDHFKADGGKLPE